MSHALPKLSAERKDSRGEKQCGSVARSAAATVSPTLASASKLQRFTLAMVESFW